MNRLNFKRLVPDPVFFKFILIGILNTVIGSAIMFGLYNLAGLGYWVSSVLNCGITSIFSFFLNKGFTFGIKGWSLRMTLVFALVIVISYIVAYSIAKPFVYYILWNYSRRLRDNAAMLTGMGFFTTINYLGQRYIVFKKRKHDAN
jgi:putative flippase GtrA